MTNSKKRIPSETYFLPPMKVLWAVTDPDKPENKYNPEQKQWSIRLVSTDEDNRKAVEQQLGPILPRFLDVKREELIAEAEAKGDKIALKRLTQGDDKVGPLDYELPWRDRLSRETAEPTGELELVLKRDEFKIDRRSKKKVRNDPPIVVDAQTNQIDLIPPPGSIVVCKMATWPVYFAKDNKVGMKKLLEAIQVISMPAGRKPDASGFERYDDGYSAAEGADEGEAGEREGSSPGADY